MEELSLENMLINVRGVVWIIRMKNKTGISKQLIIALPV